MKGPPTLTNTTTAMNASGVPRLQAFQVSSRYYSCPRILDIGEVRTFLNSLAILRDLEQQLDRPARSMKTDEDLARPLLLAANWTETLWPERFGFHTVRDLSPRAYFCLWLGLTSTDIKLPQVDSASSTFARAQPKVRYLD